MNNANLIQYNTTTSKDYTNLVKLDPQKQFVQYPEALHFLGDVNHQVVLDVGCGSGAFAQELARRGALVTGYDSSPEQINIANKIQDGESGNIKYLISTPGEFISEKKFDIAVSVLVLHYANDINELRQFFSSTNKALKEGSKFVCILVNPNFKRQGEILYNRRFDRLGNKKMKADFLDGKKNVLLTVNFSDFSTEDYERAAHDGGFKKIEWKKLSINKEGLQKLGREYWRGFEDDCPFVGFIAYC